ncbi:MAG TPA: hypothetical protein VIF09_07715 [Polyangiaceae bacterium]
MRRHVLLPLLSILLVPVTGCAAGETASDPTGSPVATDDGGFGSDPSSYDAFFGDDAAASSVPPWDADFPGDADGDETTGDAGATPDAAPEGACVGPLAPGDLIIDELMIESVAGTGDYGEWLEVASQRDCALDLRGLHGECPSGVKVRTFDITDDAWLPAGGFFLIADSVAPALNHDLPGTVVPWTGQPGDVLRNKGGTVTLRSNQTIVDSVTYPALKLTVGTSVAFPASCPATRRSDWSAWQTSRASWFPGFYGTPGAPDVDVQCL